MSKIRGVNRGLWIAASTLAILAIVFAARGGEKVNVCNTDSSSPHYGKIITVRKGETSHYGPVSDPACAPR